MFFYADTVHDYLSGTIQVVHSLAGIDISVDRARCAPGETMTVGLEIANPRAAVQLALRIGVETPGGNQVWVLQNPALDLPAGLSYDNDTWQTYTLTQQAYGTYTWNAALLKMPENVLISEDEVPFTFRLAEQGDWSGGPGVAGPVPWWEAEFESSAGVSWQAVDGRLALGVIPRGTLASDTVAVDAGRPNSVSAGDLDGDGLVDLITTDPVYIINERGAV